MFFGYTSCGCNDLTDIHYRIIKPQDHRIGRDKITYVGEAVSEGLFYIEASAYAVGNLPEEFVSVDIKHLLSTHIQIIML
jgi:hypothetical protein